MRFKATWILIAIFAALVGYLYFVEEPQQLARQEAEEKKGLVFPDLDVDAVNEIALAGKKGSARARRGDDGKWFLVEPWDDRADDGRVGKLLADLRGLKTDREVAGPDADLEGYGLAEPEVTVVTSGKTVKLLVGADNPAGDARYVQVDDGPVQLAKNPNLTGLFLDPGDLRNKELLESYPWDRLASLEIRPPDSAPVRLVKNGEAWRLEAPILAEADPDAAQKVTDKLRWARVNRFLEKSQAEVEEKLSRGLAVILGAEGEEPPVTLRMAEVDGVVWADRTGRNALFTVSNDVLETFQVGAGDLRRKKPLLVQPWKVKRLEINLAGNPVAFEKMDGAWRRGSGALAETENTALQNYLRNLETGNAERVIDAPGSAAEYGLDEPELTVRITAADGEQTLAVGRKGDKVYAQTAGSGPVYEMPADYFDRARRVVEPSEPAEGGDENPCGVISRAGAGVGVVPLG